MHEPLPPSITISPTAVGVSLLTLDGVTIQVSLPRPRGLRHLPDEEITERARRLAKAALTQAAETLQA